MPNLVIDKTWLVDPAYLYESDLDNFKEDGETFFNVTKAGTDNFSNNSATTTKIQAGSVTTPKIADDAVTADKLASDISADVLRAVGTNHFRDGSVTEAKLAVEIFDPLYFEEVGGSFGIKDGSIGQEKLADRTAGTGVGGVSGSTGVDVISPTVGEELVPGLAVTLTTIGRPVLVFMQNQNFGASSNESGIDGFYPDSAFAIFRNGSPVYRIYGSANVFGTTVSGNPYGTPAAGHIFVDNPGAGTHTWQIYMTKGSEASWQIVRANLKAFEL